MGSSFAPFPRRPSFLQKPFVFAPQSLNYLSLLTSPPLLQALPSFHKQPSLRVVLTSVSTWKYHNPATFLAVKFATHEEIQQGRQFLKWNIQEWAVGWRLWQTFLQSPRSNYSGLFLPHLPVVLDGLLATSQLNGMLSSWGLAIVYNATVRHPPLVFSPKLQSPKRPTLRPAWDHGSSGTLPTLSAICSEQQNAFAITDWSASIHHRAKIYACI